jgi:hypothetical protein
MGGGWNLNGFWRYWLGAVEGIQMAGLLVGSCECSDEPWGFGTTELVSAYIHMHISIHTCMC